MTLNSDPVSLDTYEHSPFLLKYISCCFGPCSAQKLSVNPAIRCLSTENLCKYWTR